VIFGIALLVFGPKKFPELGRELERAFRGFKAAVKTDEEKPASTTATIADVPSIPMGESWFWHGNPSS